jgi:hypothetical protein
MEKRNQKTKLIAQQCKVNQYGRGNDDLNICNKNISTLLIIFKCINLRFYHGSLVLKSTAITSTYSNLHELTLNVPSI